MNSPNASEYLDRVRFAVELSGFTQTKIAEALNVSQPTVSQWVNGSRTPPRSVGPELARVLGVRRVWLESGEGEPGHDLTPQRLAYRKDLSWVFRTANPDGTRDYGNANIFSFDPDVDTFVREVLQNIKDAVGPGGGQVSARFVLRQLRGQQVTDFLDVVGWQAFEPHLRASIKSGQQVGSALTEGLQAVEARELLLLEITDTGTTGLLGPDIGEGNFAALCRNNLFSDKNTSGAGGSYGLGKAVLWRMSALSTVFFFSDLVEPPPGLEDRSGRFIGRTELVWHETPDDQAFAGPGYLGVADPEQPQLARSLWDNEALRQDLNVPRKASSSGTTIVVMGFRDPSVDEQQTPKQIAEAIEAAVARHFWPALTSSAMAVSVEVVDSKPRSAEVDVDTATPQLAAMLRTYASGGTVDQLLAVGDVVQVPVVLPVPARRAAGSEHPAFDHTAVLLIRRADPAETSETVDQVQYFRGPGMIVSRVDLKRMLVGAQPFHAAVLCGTSAGDGVEAERAERFLRAAEPPAHNKWVLTEKVTREYARGGQAGLDRFQARVREAIREALIPAVDNPADGPRELSSLFKLGEPSAAERAPRLVLDSATVNPDNGWTIEATLRIPVQGEAGRRQVVGRPQLRFDRETGGAPPVSWSLTAVKNCEIDGDSVVVPAGTRTARFRAVTDPATHPVPTASASAHLTFTSSRQEVRA